MFGALAFLFFFSDSSGPVAPRKSRDGWAYLAEICGPMRVHERVVVADRGPGSVTGLNYTTVVRAY